MGIVTKLSSLFTIVSVIEVVFVLVLFMTLFEIWISFLFVSNFIRPCNLDELVRKQIYKNIAAEAAVKQIIPICIVFHAKRSNFFAEFWC